MAMFCECHLQPYLELPSDGPSHGRRKRGRPKKTREEECREGNDKTGMDLGRL